MRNIGQVVMLGLAVLLMWGGPKLQRWLNPSETASSTAAPKPPVVSQSSEVDVKRIAAGVARALVASASSDELDPTCSEVRSCGNGVIDPGEECDGANLDGMSCTRLGFTGDCGDNPFCLQSRLGCSKSCRFDLRACTVQRADEPARFVDNGDGTVTDRLTNLMWEKKCHGPGCSFDHNVRTKIDWRGAASWWLEKLNNENHHGYAGYADWRLPTIGEIQTILAEPWPCRSNPCIDESVFGDGLTGRGAYWSGISLANNPSYGWSVGFNNGKAAPQVKRTSFYVRAVRTVGVDVEIPAPADDLASPSTGGGGDRVCSWVRLCGNGLLDAAERCDQLDLGGHTCASQGYSGDCGSETYCMERSLSCSSSCRLEVSGCSALSGTEPERFVEHGDGTISDRMTGLMWERKCTGDGCAATHDARRKLAWREAASDWIQELNAEQGSGYGGYGDWRLPTIAELRSLTLEPWPCTYGPCLEPSLLGLESTIGPSYWSATTFDADKSRAWSMSLSDGRSETQSKPVELYVLAVRRGEAYTPPLLASR